MAFAKKAQLAGLSEEEQAERAFNKVLASVSVCEQSTQKMRAKLEAAGFSAASIDAALEKACRLGALDDRRYAECLIRSTLQSGRGLTFVEREVERLGIDINSLEAYEDYCELSEADLSERAFEYLERHRPKAKNLYAACYRKLITRGYSSGVAHAATKRYLSEYESSSA